MILLSDLKREFDSMSDRELRAVCGVLMPIIGKRFNKAKQKVDTFLKENWCERCDHSKFGCTCRSAL